MRQVMPLRHGEEPLAPSLIRDQFGDPRAESRGLARRPRWTEPRRTSHSLPTARTAKERKDVMSPLPNSMVES